MEPPRRPGRIAAPAPGGGKSWSGLSGAGCLGGGGVDPWAAMLVRREGLRKEAEVERLAGPGRVGMGAAQGARTGRVQGGLGGGLGYWGSFITDAGGPSRIGPSGVHFSGSMG